MTFAMEAARRALIFALFAALVLMPASATTDFLVPPGPQAAPQGIVKGPDGNMWVTESIARKIARITPAGVVTEFPVPGAISPYEIAVGPDGALWFTDNSVGQIGKITISGQVTVFPIKLKSPNFNLTGIAAGPDGNLWVLEPSLDSSGFNNSAIFRVSTAGKVVGQYTNASLFAFEIVRGPDGNMWFTNLDQPSDAIGKVSVNGAFTFYKLSGGGNYLTAGPDGNIWVPEFTGGGFAGSTGLVAKITPAGVVTEYIMPIPNCRRT